jgi:hypothetical protein
MRKERFPSFWRKFCAIGCLAAHATLFAAAEQPEPPRSSGRTSVATRTPPVQSREARLWQIAVDSDKAGAYDAYLRKYPNGRYAALARARLAEMDAAAMQSSSSRTATQPATKASTQSSPPAPHATGEQPAGDAQKGLSLSAEEELWRAATTSARESDYQAYLREYPEGRYAMAAKMRLAGSVPPGENHPPTSGMSAPAPNASGSAQAPRPPGDQAIWNKAIANGQSIRLRDQTMTGNFAIDPQTGKVSGTGRIVWTNGNRFEGTLVNGVKQGAGQFFWNNGQHYIGDWTNDVPNGVGVIVFPNGDRYEGQVKDGESHGQGSARFNSGDSYVGAWLNGKRHGHGRYVWADGAYWEGEFRNGGRTENGVLTRAQTSPVPAPRPAIGAATNGERQAAQRQP